MWSANVFRRANFPSSSFASNARWLLVDLTIQTIQDKRLLMAHPRCFHSHENEKAEVKTAKPQEKGDRKGQWENESSSKRALGSRIRTGGEKREILCQGSATSA